MRARLAGRDALSHASAVLDLRTDRRLASQLLVMLAALLLPIWLWPRGVKEPDGPASAVAREATVAIAGPAAAEEEDEEPEETRLRAERSVEEERLLCGCEGGGAGTLGGELLPDASAAVDDDSGASDVEAEES